MPPPAVGVGAAMPMGGAAGGMMAPPPTGFCAMPRMVRLHRGSKIQDERRSTPALPPRTPVTDQRLIGQTYSRPLPRIDASHRPSIAGAASAGRDDDGRGGRGRRAVPAAARRPAHHWPHARPAAPRRRRCADDERRDGRSADATGGGEADGQIRWCSRAGVTTPLPHQRDRSMARAALRQTWTKTVSNFTRLQHPRPPSRDRHRCGPSHRHGRSSGDGAASSGAARARARARARATDGGHERSSAGRQGLLLVHGTGELLTNPPPPPPLHSLLKSPCGFTLAPILPRGIFPTATRLPK